jgi:hypothetical protein
VTVGLAFKASDLTKVRVTVLPDLPLAEETALLDVTEIELKAGLVKSVANVVLVFVPVLFVESVPLIDIVADPSVSLPSNTLVYVYVLLTNEENVIAFVPNVTVGLAFNVSERTKVNVTVLPDLPLDEEMALLEVAEIDE